MHLTDYKRIIISVLIRMFLSISMIDNSDGSKIYTNSITKCCQNDEFYDVESIFNHKCKKLSKDGFEFTNDDYFIQILKDSSLVQIDDYSYEYDYPSVSQFSYNVTRIGEPSCAFDEKHIFINLPDEEIDDFRNQDFQIEYSSQELFEIKNHKFHTDYCIDFTRKNGQYHGLVAIVCEPNLDVICQTKKCLRFCCNPSEIIVDVDLVSNSRNPHVCVPLSDADQDSLLQYALNPIEDDVTDLYYVFGPPKCFEDGGYTTHDIKGGAEVFNKHGKSKSGTGSFNYENSCISYSKSLEDVSNISIFSTHIKLCVAKDVLNFEQGLQSWKQLIDFKIISGILILSTVLLCALLSFDLIYNRDKLFSALRICVIMMNLLCNCILCVVKIQVDVEKNFPNFCVAEAILIQFTYLSTICWLNTMCFDVWSKFRKMRVNNDLRRKSKYKRHQANGFQHPKYKWYALYSLGVPLVVSSITAIMHYLPENLTVGFILPFKVIKKEQLIQDANLDLEMIVDDGKAKCFFNDNLATLLYFFVMTGPILLINLVLYLLFVWSLCCGLWSQSGSNVAIHRQKRNFKRILIMFSTLGLPWICDLAGFMLVWAHHTHDITSSKHHQDYLKHSTSFYISKTILNVITASQGIIMFCAIFLFDNSIRKKCGCKNENKTDNVSKSIPMSVQKGGKNTTTQHNPFSQDVKQNKRKTPVMIAYKRKAIE